MKLPRRHCAYPSARHHHQFTSHLTVLLVLCLLLGMNSTQAALFSISFYEETGNINDADPGPGLHNFFDDYTHVGGGTFEIADSAVSPNNLVAFSSPDFLNFSINLNLSTGDSSTFTLGVDDFELTEPNERGLLFDATGAPLQFRVVGGGAGGSRTMCTPGLTSCDGVTQANLTMLTLIANANFQAIYLDTGEVTTISANMNPVEPFTPFAGDWTHFSGINVGSGETVGGYYLISAVPVPAAVWLFSSGLLGLIGVSRHKKQSFKIV